MNQQKFTHKIVVTDYNGDMQTFYAVTLWWAEEMMKHFCGLWFYTKVSLIKLEVK